MSSEFDLSAEMVHQFDQGWESTKNVFAAMVREFARVRIQAADLGAGEEFAIVQLSQALASEVPVDVLASALAFAVVTEANRE